MDIGLDGKTEADGLALANEETARVGRPEDIEPQAAQGIKLLDTKDGVRWTRD